jgi:hypothetical protein
MRSISVSTHMMKKHLIAVRLAINHYYEGADVSERKLTVEEHVRKFIRLFMTRMHEVSSHPSLSWSRLSP